MIEERGKAGVEKKSWDEETKRPAKAKKFAKNHTWASLEENSKII